MKQDEIIIKIATKIKLLYKNYIYFYMTSIYFIYNYYIYLFIIKDLHNKLFKFLKLINIF